VILVSDLIQNTRAISLLTALPEPEPPKGMAVSLTGVEIDVEFIDRTPSAYGEGALMEWWQELLRRCGAQLRKVRRV
jgi:hypothetical protein